MVYAVCMGNDERFIVLMPTILKAQVKVLADEADQSVSQWVRAAIREKMDREIIRIEQA
jgi:hypothetical protein